MVDLIFWIISISSCRDNCYFWCQLVTNILLHRLLLVQDSESYQQTYLCLGIRDSRTGLVQNLSVWDWYQSGALYVPAACIACYWSIVICSFNILSFSHCLSNHFSLFTRSASEHELHFWVSSNHSNFTNTDYRARMFIQYHRRFFCRCLRRILELWPFKLRNCIWCRLTFRANDESSRYHCHFWDGWSVRHTILRSHGNINVIGWL